MGVQIAPTLNVAAASSNLQPVWRQCWCLDQPLRHLMPIIKLSAPPYLHFIVRLKGLDKLMICEVWREHHRQPILRCPDLSAACPWCHTLLARRAQWLGFTALVHVL